MVRVGGQVLHPGAQVRAVDGGVELAFERPLGGGASGEKPSNGAAGEAGAMPAPGAEPWAAWATARPGLRARRRGAG